jgi:hypothetical protein
MRGNISSLEQLLSFRRKPQDNKLDRQDTPEKPSSIAPDSAEGTRKHAYHLISKELLHDVIVMKNSYMNPHKPLDALESRVQVLAGFPRGKNIENVLHQAMKLKTSDKEYADLPSIKYDSRIAPRPMQNEMVMLYATSDMTLREASIYLESRYGMHISASTLSRHARDCLKNNGQEFKNRHEAKRHYQEDIKGSSLKAAVS